jgi:UDP-3-O-[3-hydroxymyristoyl] glucosamine N-acyltransferase
MTGALALPGETLQTLAARHGGRVVGSPEIAPARFAALERAARGDLAPLLARRFVAAAEAAAGRGATLLVDASLGKAVRKPIESAWIHEHAGWVMACLLDDAAVEDVAPVVGPGCSIAPSAVLGPRVVLGKRVTVGPGAVIGYPGFGWAAGPGGAVRRVPQLGGVMVEDDVAIGPLCTIDAGTLSPTVLRRGVKLDAHVHVGHNVEIGEGTMVAAQCGFAGSVLVGRGVLIGGQTGIADHVTVGDGARIAAKSGVIGDVPAGATFGGYPAVPRARWLRGLARLYRDVASRNPA